jgi:hypothetical protein
VRSFGDVLFANCGAVGKPKDRDRRGAFAVPGPDGRVSIERVDYDAAAVARESRAPVSPAEYAEKLVAAAQAL